MKLRINLASNFQPQAAEFESKVLADEESFRIMVQGEKVRIVKNLLAQTVFNLLENAV